jgi:hypothetical protein
MPERECLNCGKGFPALRAEVFCSVPCAIAFKSAVKPQASASPEQVAPDVRGDPPTETPLHKRISLSAVARWLRVSDSDLRLLAEQGRVPARQIGDRWVFSTQSLNAWLSADLPSETVQPLAELTDAVKEVQTTLESLTKALAPPPTSRSASGSRTLIAFDFDEMPTAAQLESAYIQYVLDRCDGNKTIAAEHLGIDPSTLYRKLGR